MCEWYLCFPSHYFFVCMLTKMEENRNEVKGETSFIELGFVAA